MNGPTLATPPEQLISSDGTVAFGNYAGVPGDLAVERVAYTRLKRPPWSWFGELACKLLKRWQFVGAMDENLVVGAAVAHVNYLATGFAYVYDRKTEIFTEYNLKAPLALGAEFSRTPANGETCLFKGKRSIVMNNSVIDGFRTLDVVFGDEFSIRLKYRENYPGISTACPQMDGGFHYTYKSAGLPVEGQIRLDGQTLELAPDALGLLDWTASTPPRTTTWNWAAAVGKTGDGRVAAINFSRGLVLGSYTQNAVWIDGKPFMPGYVLFDYDREDILGKPWNLHTADRSLDLVFEPAAERFEDIDFKLVASRLHQPFGTYKGTVHTDEGPVELELFGFCEDHYAKW